MPLLQLPSINNSQPCVLGDVSIDDSVAIATGVILQADPNCRVIIHAGVCLGMGTILHAHQGNLEIHTGAILGAGVLIIGKATIGANACIGSTTTIWNTNVDPERIIPPGSVVGNSGREVKAPQPTHLAAQSNFISPPVPSISAKSNFIEPTPTPAPLVQSTFVEPTFPPVVKSTFIDPTSNPPAVVKSTFISPTPLPTVSSTFIQPTLPPLAASTFVPPGSESKSPSHNGRSPSETPPEPTTAEEPQDDNQNNNHQFYGQNRLNQLLGTLMPNNNQSLS